MRVQTAEITAAKRLLRSAGLGRGQPRSPQPARWATVLQGVELHRELRAYLEQHRAVRRCAGEQIQALQELLAAHPHPFVADLQRLHTIPGVGPIVAATVVAVLTDVQTMGGFCKGKP